LKVLEVNPRYTASTEVLERAGGCSMLKLHRAVFEGRPAQSSRCPAPAAVVAKGILYAAQPLVFPDPGPWSESLKGPIENAGYADIPSPGEMIQRGQPVLTIFASASTADACLRILHRRVRDLDHRLWG
jgi:uncharacterized protein